MQLKITVRLAILIFLAGIGVAYALSGDEAALWFAVGGGLSLVNVCMAAWVVSFGLKSAKSKGIFLGFLMLKSLTFVLVVAVILMFLKPLLLPFTSGLGVVIFASIGAAVWEMRRYLKTEN